VRGPRIRLTCVAGLILLIYTTTACSSPGEVHLGGAFRIQAATPIGDLAAHPKKYFNRNVRIEGIVASACTNEGCFMEVVPADGSAEGIVVNFSDLEHRFPTDCAGRAVVVEGMFYQKVYPASRVLHWQGHSFRKGRPVPEYSRILRMTAEAATIGETAEAALEPGRILAASIDRIGLDTLEFETDGFGTGRKILAPGEITHEHSTGNSREIVYCLEGSPTVARSGQPAVTLAPGEMSFIPPDTRHEIRNLSGKPAVYLFVFSRKPEPQVQAHPH
jgi:quercetin dioxygenase-like cupin family protein